MTQDPYRLNDDLQLSSLPSGSDDEYDGLDTDIGESADSATRKMPIVLGMMLVVFVSGVAYIAYQMFIADVAPIVPMQPSPLNIAEQSQLPPFIMEEPADASMLDDNAMMAEALLPPPALDGQELDGQELDEQELDGQELGEQEIEEQGEEAAMTPTPTPTDDIGSIENQSEINSEVADAQEEFSVIDTNHTINDQAEENNESVEIIATETVELQEKSISPQALQPIDPPETTAISDAEFVPPAMPPAIVQKAVTGTIDAARSVSQSAQRQMDEVQKILQSAGIDNSRSQAVAPPPVEVTPRAREVIVVTRSYGRESPQAMIAAGDRVLQANQYDAAIEIYNKELQKNPSDVLALAGKALALQKSGNITEAMDTYDRLLERNPHDVEALTNYLGLLQTQDPQQALIRLQNMAIQYPQNAAISGQLGMLHARLMDTPNAIRAFQKAAALDRTNATYPFNLAVLYDRLGSSAKASDEYRRALILARDYPSRSEVPIDTIRQRLGSLRN